MRALIAFLLLASTAAAQTSVSFYSGVPNGRYNNTNLGYLCDASGERVAYTFVIPMTGTITKIGFKLGLVQEEDTIAVSMQTVGTDGKPTGSNYGSSTSNTVTFTDADDNSTQEVTLGTSATATAGNVAAVVIAFSSYADGNLTINGGGVNAAANTGFPSVFHDAGGSGYTRNTAGVPMLYLYYSDGGGQYKIPVGCLPPATIGNTSGTIQSDTTPDEVAMKFTAPLACQLNGVAWMSAAESGSTAEIKFNVFSSAATPLALISPTVLVHDQLGTVGLQTVVGLEPESLTQSQSVYCAVFSEDATNNLAIAYMDVSNVAHWGDFAPHISWASRTRTTDGSPDGGPGWTDLNTRKPLGGVLINQLTTSGGQMNTPAINTLIQ